MGNQSAECGNGKYLPRPVPPQAGFRERRGNHADAAAALHGVHGEGRYRGGRHGRVLSRPAKSETSRHLCASASARDRTGWARKTAPITPGQLEI